MHVIWRTVPLHHNVACRKQSVFYHAKFRNLLSQLENLAFTPLVRSPHGIDAGRIFCAADARASITGETAGSGLCVGKFYAFGVWPKLVREALSEKKLSISPHYGEIESFFLSKR